MEISPVVRFTVEGGATMTWISISMNTYHHFMKIWFVVHTLKVNADAWSSRGPMGRTSYNNTICIHHIYLCILLLTPTSFSLHINQVNLILTVSGTNRMHLNLKPGCEKRFNAHTDLQLRLKRWKTLHLTTYMSMYTLLYTIIVPLLNAEMIHLTEMLPPGIQWSGCKYQAKPCKTETEITQSL